jgi:hypothetical protein
MNRLQDQTSSDSDKELSTMQLVEGASNGPCEIILVGEMCLRRLEVTAHQNHFVLGRFVDVVASNYVDLTAFGKAAMTVSRIHARIDIEGENLVFWDLNSRHGSYLEGRRLESNTPEPLRSGFLIRLADLELKVLLKKPFHAEVRT